MAISDKLTYLNETKSQLKDMINYGLDDNNKITSSTTFRNYVSSIFNAFLEALRTPDTLFTNLPKKSGSGSNITLNDTANAPMRIMLNATELTQDGTPTPSSPQDIHTISGSNKVVVCGKNLIPYQDKDFTINGVNFKTINGNLILNGTATFNITGDMLVNDNYLKVDVEHATYYLTRTNVNSNLTINLMGENSTLVAQLPKNSSDLSTTVSISSSNKVYLGFFIPQGATFNNYDGGIMVSKNGGTYEPYISQEAEVDLSSKNLAYTNWAIDFVTAVNALASTMITRKDNRNCVRWTAGAGYNDYDNKNFSLGIKFKENTQYTISYDILKENSLHSTICFRYTDGTTSTPSNVSETNKWEHQTLTSTAGKTIKDIAPYYSSGNTYIDLDTYMLNEGTTALDYVPYYEPINYCKIGNYEDKFIRTSGKNLLDTYSMVLGDLNNTTGAEETNTNKTHYRSDFIPVKPNTTYVFTTDYQVTGINKLMEYGSDKSFIIRNSQSSTNKTIVFTTSANTYYFRLCMYTSPAFTDFYSLHNMLNEGSTALDYEPYGSNEWYIKKNIGKVVLDGSESWAITSTDTSSVYRKMTTVLAGQTISPSSASQVGLMLCNRYLSKSANDTYLKNVGVSMASSGNLEIYDSDFTTNDISLYKTWLSSNNVILYYVLKIPTYTQITGTLAEQLENIYQKLLSYTGTTNISQVNNDLSFNLSVQAIEEL